MTADPMPHIEDFCPKSAEGILWIAHADYRAFDQALIAWQAREIERLQRRGNVNGR